MPTTLTASRARTQLGEIATSRTDELDALDAELSNKHSAEFESVCAACFARTRRWLRGVQLGAVLLVAGWAALTAWEAQAEARCAVSSSRSDVSRSFMSGWSKASGGIAQACDAGAENSTVWPLKWALIALTAALLSLAFWIYRGAERAGVVLATMTTRELRSRRESLAAHKLRITALEAQLELVRARPDQHTHTLAPLPPAPTSSPPPPASLPIRSLVLVRLSISLSLASIRSTSSSRWS